MELGRRPDGIFDASSIRIFEYEVYELGSLMLFMYPEADFLPIFISFVAFLFEKASCFV